MERRQQIKMHRILDEISDKQINCKCHEIILNCIRFSINQNYHCKNVNHTCGNKPEKPKMQKIITEKII